MKLILGLHARTAADKNIPAGLAESILECLAEDREPGKILVTYNSRLPDQEFRERFKNLDIKYMHFNVLEPQATERLLEAAEGSTLDAVINCIAGTYQSAHGINDQGQEFNPIRERQRKILTRMKENIRIAKEGGIPNPNIVRIYPLPEEQDFVPDFTREEIENTREITGYSHVKIFNKLQGITSPEGIFFSYSFTGHERTPNYEIVSPAKKVLEEHALSRNGEVPRIICLSTGIFLSPATFSMPYLREFLQLAREEFSDLQPLTSKDVARETFRIMNDKNAKSGIHYFRDEIKNVPIERQRQYLAEELKKK